MHNGVQPFPGAVRACQAFRAEGGVVILVSNAPRPGAAVAAQLEQLTVPRDTYDAIVSSGDLSRELISAHAGATVLHIGPARDLPLFDGLGVTPSSEATAPAAIVCTGLADDERETAEDYRARLAPLATTGTPMICANPDLTVERGGRLIPCAGAVAAVYASLGGPVDYAGKPHLPIYRAARLTAERIAGQDVDISGILAVGDGIRTDIDGAARYGIDSVFIASAVSLGHATLSEASLSNLFQKHERPPLAAMAELDW
ncbi:MAG: TIGR01459 family HAD-type hydrolase [Hyphomicrobiaceae bacterium]|nr:TIGR01459 family HAD-type hydrolase [Hyphomicrobiaceae bacterium]